MGTAPANDNRIDQAVAHYQAEASRWAAAGRPDHAAHFHAAALDHRPGDSRVRMMLADCLVRCNQRTAAAGEYLRVALGYAEQRRDAEAMALAHHVLNLDASQLVYVAVADALRRIGRQARPLCARAAEAHLQAGRLADGLHMLRLGAEIDARNPEVRRRLAQIYLAQHMYTDAVTNLAEAGQLLLAAGNNAEYVEVAEQILRVDPRHLETLRELPRVYLRVGEAQRAVVKLADLMRASPGDTVGYETLAHAFAVLGRAPTALSVLERLTAELIATGRAPQAEAILERARGWRLEDPDFARAVLALRAPKPMPAPPRPRAPRPTTAEGTVVLDIRDLMASDDAAVLDLSDEVIEIGEIEGTRVQRARGIEPCARSSANSQVGRAPRRTAPLPAPRRVAAPPAPRRVAAPPAPRRLPVPPPLRRAMLPAEVDQTQALDLGELEEITLVRRSGAGDVTSLVIDEDSAELAGDPRSRAAMLRRARELARRSA